MAVNKMPFKNVLSSFGKLARFSAYTYCAVTIVDKYVGRVFIIIDEEALHRRNSHSKPVMKRQNAATNMPTFSGLQSGDWIFGERLSARAGNLWRGG